MRNSLIRTALASAAILALSAPASAQDDLAEKAKDIAEQANEVEARAGALANEATNVQAEREGRDDRDGGDRVGDESANGAGAADRDHDDGDGDGGKWGLLGLLGLAGLLGLRKKDDHRVHTDPRDRRP